LIREFHSFSGLLGICWLSTGYLFMAIA
jgi:hypothetical protein